MSGWSWSQVKIKHDDISSDDKNRTVKAMGRAPAALVVMAISFVAFWFVGVLSAFHTYLIATNQTTYENFRDGQGGTTFTVTLYVPRFNPPLTRVYSQNVVWVHLQYKKHDVFIYIPQLYNHITRFYFIARVESKRAKRVNK